MCGLRHKRAWLIICVSQNNQSSIRTFAQSIKLKIEESHTPHTHKHSKRNLEHLRIIQKYSPMVSQHNKSQWYENKVFPIFHIFIEHSLALGFIAKLGCNHLCGPMRTKSHTFRQLFLHFQSIVVFIFLFELFKFEKFVRLENYIIQVRLIDGSYAFSNL